MSDERANKGSREDVYSKAVRAGKRTYFFDVKATRGNDLYITITESKKRFSDDGTPFYEKHKLFLYKEDFEKFVEGLQETVAEIENLRDQEDIGQPEDSNSNEVEEIEETEVSRPYNENGSTNSYTDLKFEDLEN